jgi:hypothetical protein
MKHLRYPLIAVTVILLTAAATFTLLQGCDDDRKAASQQQQQEVASLRDAVTAKDQEIVQLRQQVEESRHGTITWTYAMCLVALAGGIAFVAGLAVGSSALRAYQKQGEAP